MTNTASKTISEVLVEAQQGEDWSAHLNVEQIVSDRDAVEGSEVEE